MFLQMDKTHVHWLARVSVECCDRDRGEGTAALAADLALAGLQLILPLFYYRREMSRLDTRRGEASLSSPTVFHLFAGAPCTGARIYLAGRELVDAELPG